MMNRRGMTLVELLVAVVVAGAVMAAAYQVLVINQRIYTVQREQIVGHQTIRAGANVLFTELREVSAADGDLLAMDTREVEFRAMRAFGLVCAINPSQSRIWVVFHGQRFDVGQTALVFVDNDPEDSSDDEWASSGIQSASDDASGCSESDDVQVLGVSGLASDDFSGMRTGAPVRAAETYTYGAFQVDEQWYLARRSGGGDPVPLVGPLEGQTGVEFEYLDTNGNPTTTPAQVRRIRTTLRTRSDVLDRLGNPVADSLSVDVFIRN